MIRSVTEAKIPVSSPNPVRAPAAAAPSAAPILRSQDGMLAPVAGKPAVVTTDTGKLTFHGGAVLKNPEIVPVYLYDYWASGPGAADRKTLDTSLAQIVTAPETRSLWAQYGVGPGTVGTSVVIPGKAPAVVTQAMTQQLLQKAIQAGVLSTANPEAIFTTVLPPGIGLQSPSGASSLNGGGLGGFHSSFGMNGKPVYFADLVYSKGTNGIDFQTGNALDNVTATASHEITETATDPDVNSKLPGRGLGWYDDTTPWVRADGTKVTDPTGQTRSGKGEIGDIPVLNAELAGDRTLASAVGRIAAGPLVQKEWSNVDNRSELGALHPGPVQPLPAPVKGPGAGGNQGKQIS